MSNETKAKVLAILRRNRLIRFLFYPYMTLKRENAKRTFCKSEDAEFIKSLHNTYKGKRCFIIGNGPSLTVEDLDKLKGEYCFASNKILWLLDKTDWRPTFYACCDKDAFCVVEDKLSEFNDIKYKFITYELKKKGKSDLHYLCYYIKFAIIKERLEPEFSEDISKYVGESCTITSDMIQIAVYLGFSEIYLLGVDHNYSKVYDSNGKVVVADSIIQNYAKGIPDWGQSVFNINFTTRAYRTAREYCDTHGIKICNATRGGKLEVFERVDFDSLFSDKTQEVQ